MEIHALKHLEEYPAQISPEKKLIARCILLAGAMIAGAVLYTAPVRNAAKEASVPVNAGSGDLEDRVLPPNGVAIPVKWKDLGAQMVRSGVIDPAKFEKLYANRGGLSQEERRLLEGMDNGNLKMTAQNSGYILNLLWAFGLANKNQILESGPMRDPKYGDAGKFASTGGWTLAKGSAMDHYSKHNFVEFTKTQQEIVERVSKNIYRPCCGNSTYFPDCNHGMAMLGLLELMASQGVTEKEMYRVALQTNSYWFPETYLAIAQYFSDQGISWDKVDPKTALGADYSSASGYREIMKKVTPPERKNTGGGGCGV